MELKKTKGLLEKGMALGQQIGGQLHVRKGEERWDFAFGEARPGVAMTADSLTLWFSTGKPLTAIAIGLLMDRGELELDLPVAEVIPEFSHGGKDAITIRHLLTHTGGFRNADKIAAGTPWPEVIAKICATPLEKDWVPGMKGAYHPASAWFILGEIIKKCTGLAFAEFIRREVLSPLGMDDTHFHFSSEQLLTYGNRLSLMYSTATSQPNVLPLENEAGLSLPRPGSSARGPVQELGEFYAMLLQEGRGNGMQILQPATVRQFITPQRVGMYDYTFMHIIDFGLGFIINSNRYGVETVPYGYGRYASDRAFGHSGAESSCAFADPEHNLIVAWVLNGMCGERAHNKRARELNSAIYEDLGLAV